MKLGTQQGEAYNEEEEDYSGVRNLLKEVELLCVGVVCLKGNTDPSKGLFWGEVAMFKEAIAIGGAVKELGLLWRVDSPIKRLLQP